MIDAYNYLLESKLLSNNCNVVIGVSGGPDSMALLHLLILLREKNKFNIICAHINHNVRVESDDEAVFVEKFCKENDIVFEYIKLDKYKAGNFEMYARNKRYEFFDSLINKYNSKVLFTAHHGDDLIETILMRIVRGSTLKGYAGFSKVTDMINYKLVRPLIYTTKDEIVSYNKENNISYVTDLSNESDDYTRNRYRHHILPLLKKEDKYVNSKFLKFSETLLESANYIDKISTCEFERVFVNNILNIDEFLKLDIVIKKRIINYMLETIYNNNLEIITDTHRNLIYNLIISTKPNATLEFPNGVLVIKKYNELILRKEKLNIADYKIILDEDVILPNNKKISFVDIEESDSNFVCRLDSSEISLPLYVRNKIDGDKMNVKGMNGSKKIKDILINSKVSIDDRAIWPIVLDSNNNIIWLPGLKKSKYNKDKNEKYDIILKYD